MLHYVMVFCNQAMNYWVLPGEQILNSLWIQLKLSSWFGWCENDAWITPCLVLLRQAAGAAGPPGGPAVPRPLTAVDLRTQPGDTQETERCSVTGVVVIPHTEDLLVISEVGRQASIQFVLRAVVSKHWEIKQDSNSRKIRISELFSFPKCRSCRLHNFTSTKKRFCFWSRYSQ